MVLDAAALPRTLLLTMLALAGAPGCWSGPSDGRTAHDLNRQMDRMERMGDDLSRREQSGVTRSQAPGGDTPIAPVVIKLPPQSETAPPSAPGTLPQPMLSPPQSPSSGVQPAAATLPAQPPASLASPSPSRQQIAPQPITGEAQVRVVAYVSHTPIYESEVREAVNQRLSELLAIPEAERPAREKQMFVEELRRIIERELIVDELFAMLKGKNKPPHVLTELQETAAKEADKRMREFKQRAKVSTDEDFKTVLEGQGLTVPGLRRYLERTFMMHAYLQQLISTPTKAIGLTDVRDYYEAHLDEFQAQDSVKWQDLFVHAERFGSRAEARQYAEGLLARAKQGEDFNQLIQQYDHGLKTKFGEGEKRGEIRPVEAENTVLSLRQGEAAIVEMETGFHVVRVAERTYAGRRPFDEKAQMEIRKKLQAIVQEREYKRVVEALWRRVQPQILVTEP